MVKISEDIKQLIRDEGVIIVGTADETGLVIFRLEVLFMLLMIRSIGLNFSNTNLMTIL